MLTPLLTGVLFITQSEVVLVHAEVTTVGQFTALTTVVLFGVVDWAVPAQVATAVPELQLG
jgi:hypothetical protein